MVTEVIVEEGTLDTIEGVMVVVVTTEDTEDVIINGAMEDIVTDVVIESIVTDAAIVTAVIVIVDIAGTADMATHSSFILATHITTMTTAIMVDIAIAADGVENVVIVGDGIPKDGIVVYAVMDVNV